jgi:hypothetical protein
MKNMKVSVNSLKLLFFNLFFNNISEEEIDDIVSNICQTNRNLGEVMIWGMLKNQKIFTFLEKNFAIA